MRHIYVGGWLRCHLGGGRREGTGSLELAVVAHTFNSSILGRQKQEALFEFESRLVYLRNSWPPQDCIVRPCLQKNKINAVKRASLSYTSCDSSVLHSFSRWKTSYWLCFEHNSVLYVKTQHTFHSFRVHIFCDGSYVTNLESTAFYLHQGLFTTSENNNTNGKMFTV